MNKAIPNAQTLLLLLLAAFGILVLDSTPILNLPKRLIFFITNPISFGIYRTYQGGVRQFDFIFQGRFAVQENKALKEQLGQLLSENADLRKKLAEAETRLSQTLYISPQTYNLLPVRPIGLGRYLKIDKGALDGLKVGWPVVYKDNLLGKITSLSPKASFVQLLQDPDSKVAAFSQGAFGKAKGILIGQFGSDLLLDKILHEERIEMGDLVYSEGTEEYLPRGLVLGKVIKVDERPNEVFKQAKIQPVFDIRDLELVFVIME